MTDSQFNIKIKEYRAISEADIDINGITVLSGVNGCGKSSISFFFYNFFNILLNFDVYINLDIYNKIEAPLKLIEQLLTEIELENQLKITSQIASRFSSPRNTINLLLNNLINQRKDYNNKFYTKAKLDRIFKEVLFILKAITEEKFLNDAQRNSLNRVNNIIINSYLAKNSINYHDNIYLNVISLQKHLLDKISQTEKYRNYPPKQYINILLSNIYSKKEQVDNITIKEYNARIYDDSKERVIIPQSIKEVFYIDAPDMLEGYEDQFSLAQHKKYLQNRIKITNRIAPTLNDISNLLNNSILNGSIEFDEQLTNGDSYKYVRNDGKSFDLTDCATGIKSFAVIDMLYKKGLLNSETLLIIDEPEIHLHPQWVVEYARLVVLLNKHLGVKFLIASHHPEFVSSIRYISEKEKTTDGLNFYIAEKAENDSFKFKYKHLGIDIEGAFESFNKSFELFDQYVEEDEV